MKGHVFGSVSVSTTEPGWSVRAAHLDGGTDYATGWVVDAGEEIDGRLGLSVRVRGPEVASTSAVLGG